MTSKCASCDACIAWVQMASGKWMPIDDRAHPDGNIFCLAGQWRVVKAGDAKLDVPHYRSHFATCPNAAGHRRWVKKGGRK